MNTKYKAFLSSNEVQKWLAQFNSFFPSDNDTDKEFLKAIDFYTASANPVFNNYLRYNTKLDPEDFDYPYVMKMLEKINTYYIPDNIIVYRYISKGLLKEMCPSYPPKKNMIMQDKGFMSTTLIKESVNSYRANRSQNILLVISVPIGTKGMYVGHLKNTLDEYEVLLAPSTQLHIDYKLPFFNCYFKCTAILS